MGHGEALEAQLKVKRWKVARWSSSRATRGRTKLVGTSAEDCRRQPQRGGTSLRAQSAVNVEGL